MQLSADLYLIYLLPILLIWMIYVIQKKLKSRKNLAVMNEEFEAGLTEPASLHPLIDLKKCMGCGTCVKACPEQHNHPVLGLIDGKAQLIAPTNCIGHGACKTACPFDAITLVFGTEKRGVDIPVLKPNFETSMPGIYIAGELGGMGLIRNAIEQGYKALDHIYEDLKSMQAEAPLDVVIVGAGPSGFSSSLRSMEKKLRYKTVEQDSLGGTVFQFPRGKLVMTAPVKLPLVGEMKFTETTKEKLLEFWQQVEKKTGVKINYHERVEAITKNDKGGYDVKTNRDCYHTRSVLLTIGRRGTPRKLGVEGEDMSKVTYRLIDPEQYRNQHVLVVGGGDSALEAATSIADEPGTTVTLSYRSGAFGRAKRKNRERVDAAVKAGRINLMFNSNVKGFTTDTVTIEQKGKEKELPNNAAIVCAGGILPTGFLKETGISVETKHGTE
ncbi:MAG: NAD(P)-binding domain-containing protein [Candidatus Thiodiazotropha sp. (ex Monitilora ramsayi)]|nr:NAD(P)-binding domain-containing protein [Candidatus Thiodiazotropha sp. (ex Monitilora ramsayi)]